MTKRENQLGKRIELHTHSLLSDGVLLPSEIAARAQGLRYKAIAVTDHVDESNLEFVLSRIVSTLESIDRDLDVLLIPGVELTHVPPRHIERLSKRAKDLGAVVVIVHGQSPVEPVAGGTNEAAATSNYVDVLAHPGMLTEKEAEIARDNGVYLELTSRRGHCLANGRVARMASALKVKCLVNTDMHEPGELLLQQEALKVALGSGLSMGEALSCVRDQPKELLRRLGIL